MDGREPDASTRSVLVAALAALAVPVQALAGSEVPFKGSDASTWGQGSHDCGSLFPVRIDGVGTATHIGKYAYTSRECVDFGSYPFPYSGRFMVTAANGDRIVGTYAGTAAVADDGVTILYHQLATITAGTGRFQRASGQIDVDGVAYNDGTYTQDLDGVISSVGGS